MKKMGGGSSYGAGSVSEVAKQRKAAIAREVASERAVKRPPTVPGRGYDMKKAGQLLLDLLTGGKGQVGVKSMSGPMNQDSRAIRDRVKTEQALKKEVGGRR